MMKPSCNNFLERRISESRTLEYAHTSCLDNVQPIPKIPRPLLTELRDVNFKQPNEEISSPPRPTQRRTNKPQDSRTLNNKLPKKGWTRHEALTCMHPGTHTRTQELQTQTFILTFKVHIKNISISSSNTCGWSEESTNTYKQDYKLSVMDPSC